MNLTPEELAFLQQYLYKQGQYGLQEWNVNVTGPDGQTYHPTYTGGMSSDNTSDTTTLTGFTKDVNPGHNQVGDMQQMYDPSGLYQGTAAIPKDTSTADLLKFAAMAATMGYGGSMLNGMGGGSFGVLGDAATATGMGGPASFGVLGDAATATGFGGGSAAGGMSNMFGSSPTSFGVLGDPTTATKIVNFGPTSALSGVKGLLGPAATALGAIAGAQGVNKEQTDTRKTDPRVDPYLFGAAGSPGLLQYTQGLLNQQMSPAGMAGYQNMQSVGQGLLSNPIAGNGFGAFTKGRY